MIEWKQRISAGLIVFTEPLNLIFIFPFAFFMVESFNVGSSRESIGFYVGILSAAFPAGQFITNMFWGYLSTRFGRKPILIIGVIGTGFGTIAFGFSIYFWMAVGLRFASGLFSGGTAIARTMIEESSEGVNRSNSLSFLGFATGLGFVGWTFFPIPDYFLYFSPVCHPVAPIISAIFSNPADSFSTQFGTNEFFIKFPYFLPSVIIGGLSVCFGFLDIFIMKETLDKVSNLKPQESLKDHMKVVSSPFVLACISLFAIITLVTIIFDEVFVLLMIEDDAHNGLDLETWQISILLVCAGITLLIVQILFFTVLSPLIQTVGPLKIYTVTMLCSIPVYICFPLIQTLVVNQRKDIIAHPDHLLMHEIFFWIVIVSILCMRVAIGYVSIVSALITISNCVRPQHLTTVNTFSQTLAAAMRVVGPFLGGAIWSWAARKKLFFFDFYLVFLLVALLCAVGFTISLFIPARANHSIAQATKSETLLETVVGYGSVSKI